jgi:enterochelin esterase-like enzyme
MPGMRWNGGRAARLVLVGLLGAAGVFVAVGFAGVEHYGRNYWLYRGFPPPSDPAYVTQTGTREELQVRSPALGGRAQQVYVYLPPGYADNPDERYPVLYLLHGFPGRPLAFLLTVRTGVVEDELVAKDEGQPMILVMPFGSTGTFTDKEWADGIHRGEGWSTFVARDLVRTIDATYRTIPTAAARGIGGLSEGGYGAINIALHHPAEFHLVESWSGYEKAPKIPSIFGAQGQELAANTPLEELPLVARSLRQHHVYVWFYSGADDPFRRQNLAFSEELARNGVVHRFQVFPGGHNWALWRGEAQASMLTASERLAHG